MSQVYIEIDTQVTPTEPWADLLIAALGDIGYESFENTDTGFLGYIAASDYDPQTTQTVLQTYSEHCSVSFSSKEIAATNWNADWEKNFSPITVGERLKEPPEANSVLHVSQSAFVTNTVGEDVTVA